MRFAIKLAWRNIFRNKRRTIIAGIAIAVGLAAMMFTDAFMIGMKNNMIKSATSSFLGQAQIHGRGYRTTQEPENTVSELRKVISELKTEKIIEHFTLRAQNFGMITSPANISSILLVGIDPETEKDISQIDDAIVEGKYLGNGGDRDMVIGSKLAEILEVTVGDRVVVTVSRAHGNDLAQEMFRISGIYSFHINELDSGLAFSKLEKVQHMLGIGDNVQEIALKFKDIRLSTQKDNSFFAKYSKGGNEAVSWTEILPQITSALSVFEFVLYVMALILFGIVAFGIINTQFMSLYERMFEFGVLRAVGTRSSGIRRLIIFEAGALAVLSIVLGIGIGFILTFMASRTGIDYSGIEFAGATMVDRLYPAIQIKQYFIYPTAVFLFTLLVSLYPAIVAGNMSVSESLRKSL